MKLPSLGSIFETVKQASISLIAMSGALFGLYTCYDALTGDLVIVDTLRVPPAFENLGYNGEITTQRLLDEIARVNSLASLAKERKKYGDNALFDSIAQSDAKIAGIDVKSIRGALQKAMGREPLRITGEIAQAKLDGKDAFTVRLRSSPPRRLLVDVVVDGEPGQVLEKTAMALLEQLDPAIAVSIYRQWNDYSNALRMVDAALTNDDPTDDQTVVQQRSFVYAQLGKFAEAEADALASAGFGRHTALANLYRETEKFDLALAECDAAIQASPQNPQGYYLKGRVYLRMKKTQEAIETLRQSSAKFPTYWTNHSWLGVAYMDAGNYEQAKLAFGRALAIAPQQYSVHFSMAEVENKLGNQDAALIEYRKAHAMSQMTPLYLVALLEAEKRQGDETRIATLTKELQSALPKKGFPDRLRPRAEAALKMMTAAKP